MLRYEQGVEAARVLDEPGEAPQDGDVVVGFGGDGDDEVRGLAGIPFDPGRNLQHRDAVAADHRLVLHHAVRDGDAVAQKRVRGGFAAFHAGGEILLHAAGGDQQLRSLGNGLLLGGGGGGEADELACKQGVLRDG